MGLTHQSCGSGKTHYRIALAGNPNTGKSTLFNALTGLNQHTGNWPGKTVLRAEGKYIHAGRMFSLVDLPGTYSLLANSPEEQVARDYLCFSKPDATVVVVDATCLERNLNLVLQVLEMTPKVVVCVNLMDEAKRKKINVDIQRLSTELGVPAVATAARQGHGLDTLVTVIADIASGRLQTSPYIVQYSARLEEAVARIEPHIKELIGEAFNSRWLSLRILEQDQTIINALEQWLAKGMYVEANLGGEVWA